MINEALRYLPIVYMDKREPFCIRKIGFFEYTELGERSKSFNRSFELANYKGAVRVLEYTYYLDYDIQHLYDMEHIWIYLDEKGQIVGAEGSYHGRFLCAYRGLSASDLYQAKELPFAEIREDSHVVMYSQPGKHAMLAKPSLMCLYPELFESCGRLAGIHGLDAPDEYLKDIHVSEEDNKRIAEHIRKKYSFTPSMEFEKSEVGEEQVCDVDRLKEDIPGYLKRELDSLGIAYYM